MDNLYSNDICIDTSSPLEFEDVLAQLKKLDKKLHRLKKKKGEKKGNKKKLKRRIKALEIEHQQLKQFMIFTAHQLNAKPQQKDWWKDVIINSLPKALEFATATVNRLPAKSQSQLCLPDKGDMH